MFGLFIRCPVTADAVSTGIRLNTANWNKAAVFWAYSRCPACGADHEWQAKDAKLVASAASPDRESGITLHTTIGSDEGRPAKAAAGQRVLRL